MLMFPLSPADLPLYFLAGVPYRYDSYWRGRHWLERVELRDGKIRYTENYFETEKGWKKT